MSAATTLLRWTAGTVLGALLVLGAAGALGAGATAGGAGAEIGDPALRAEVAGVRPDVLLLGNSMLAEGVDAGVLQVLLDEALGRAAPRVLRHAPGGTYTAYWYLYLKNVAFEASRPRLVVIPFRDPLLTHASFRVSGPYAGQLRRAARPEEPVLERVLARRAEGGAIGDRVLAWLRETSAAFAARDDRQAATFDALRGLPARLAPGTIVRYSEASAEVLPPRAFEGAGEDGEALAQDVLEHDLLDFDRELARSLLPEIVALCRKHGARLALLRLKPGFRPDWSDRLPSAALDRYESALDAWLASQDVAVLDTRLDQELVPALFASVDHLGDQGRALLTLRLAAWLASAPRGLEAEEGEFRRVVTTASGDLAEAREEIIGLPTFDMQHMRNRLHRVALPAALAAEGDTESDPRRSTWTLYEDGRELGEAHAPLPLIAREGGGRYAHRGPVLYFSSSDGSSPIENGRRYELRRRVVRLAPRAGG